MNKVVQPQNSLEHRFRPHPASFDCPKSRQTWVCFCAVAVLLSQLSGFIVQAQETEPSRTVWSTSKIVGSPEPPPPLKQVLRFPNLKFKQPLYVERDPANQRIWVITREGRVWSFPDNPDVSKADLFVDFRKVFDQLSPHRIATKVNSALGLAFHPDYPKVPVCWVTYTMQTDQRKDHPEDGTRLSRFNVTFDGNGVPTCDVASEKLLMSWLEGGHNGGCLKFGPDGYLYISAGDGEVPNPPDQRRAGQDVTNVLSTIMRIDVNPADDGPLYSIPADNPFAPGTATHQQQSPDSELYYSRSEAKPEIWAYGFRNPWKMNFGPDGQLWVGDVGWELYEMVYNVKAGGNYGWSIFEGPQPVIPDGKRGPTPIVPAAVAYSHAEGASVTGGFVYQGSSFPELKGKYVFGDYETRRIWSADISPDPNGAADTLTDLRDLVDPSVRIVAFGEDTKGELLLLHFDEGTIYGLERNEIAGQPSRFPQQLSETGLFADVAAQTPDKGVIPFAINEPMWNDGATAQRFVGVPSSKAINVLPKERRMKESSLRERMQFPANSVLARTVTLQDDTGTFVKLETQILHFNGKIWNPYTFIWNTSQTDATLASASGTELNLADYGKFATRKKWHVHSRSECTRCHNSWAGGALAFSLPQLNSDAQTAGDGRTSSSSDNGLPVNQLERFRRIGMITGAVPKDVANSSDPRVAALAPSRDGNESVESRARSWLSVNCAHCHQRGAGGTATIDLRHNASIDEMKAVGAIPVQGTFQIPGGAVIKPGDPSRSVLLYRIACSGRGRMPHIGSERVDIQGVTLLREWIASLGSKDTRPTANPSLKFTPNAMDLLTKFDANEIEASERESLLKQAQEAAPEIRNLFVRFQPPEVQEQLNRKLNVNHLLALRGNAARGATMFSDKRIQCINCHQIGGKGGQIGPSLDDVGKRLKRVELLDSILHPSRKIDPKFAAWTLLTVGGKVHSGLLVNRTDGQVTLRTTKNVSVTVAKDDIEELIQQTTSLMPDRLLNDLADQQIADLLQFLAEQKQSADP